MSNRKRPYSSDKSNNWTPHPVKRFKRFYSPTPNINSNIVFDKFESQDIWRNLDRIKKNRSNSDKVIKNSILFIDPPQTQSIKDSINFLFQYISPSKLHYSKTRERYYITLEKFTLLDCCLVISILLSNKDKIWIQPYNKDFTQISKDLHLNGSIFVPQNCYWPKDDMIKESLLTPTNFTVQESKITQLASFRSFHLRLHNGASLTYFINGIVDFISSLKFGKNPPNSIKKQFEIVLNSYHNNVNSHIMETSLIGNSLFDIVRVKNQNAPLIKNTKESISKYINQLITNNKINTVTEDVHSQTTIKNTINHTKNVKQDNQEHTNLKRINSKVVNGDVSKNYPMQNKDVPRLLDQNNISQMKPKHLSPDDIKQYCICTVKATLDAVKKMASDTIFKVYIKCPKQNYAEKINQNLDTIRSKTNCNVVILHINNIPESREWFSSLSMNRYTSINDPPPMTTKVVSIGGIGEYIDQALELIMKILQA